MRHLKATAFALVAAGACAFAPGAASARTAAPDPDPPSALVSDFAEQVIGQADNEGKPFAIVDKLAAEVFVYEPDGTLKAAAPVLLGLATGDDSTPGIGDRPLKAITPEERTTPAGRFEARYGPDADGHSVFWVDYEDAISMHAVIKGEPGERRFQRLRSPSIDDNRITFGCINVPGDFYRKVVRPTFKDAAGGVVYILPEETPLAVVFPAFSLDTAPRLAEAPSLGSGAPGAN
jgi:hypothetical protein